MALGDLVEGLFYLRTHRLLGRSDDRRGDRCRKRLTMERLEERRVMAIFTVTSLLDSFDAGTLRRAVSDANLNGETDTIVLGVPGTITLTLGALQISSDMTIEAQGANSTVDGNSAGRVFNVDDSDGAPNRNVTLRNFTISNGRVIQSASPNSGGGIRNTENLVLHGMTITGNSAATGGGLSNTNGGIVQATQSTLSNNSAYYQGGGLANLFGATITLTDCTISGNSAGTTNNSSYSSFGGGILNSGNLTAVGGSIRGNTVSHVNLSAYGAFGGGISNTGSAVAVIRQSTITGNTGELGGAIHAGVGSTYLRDTIVGGPTPAEGNLGSRGGGVFVSGGFNMVGGALRHNRTVNLGGSSELGGGASIGPGGSASFDGVSILDNSTLARGGAIYMSTYGGVGASTVTIRNSTVSGNSAGDLGGAVSAGSGTTLTIDDSDLDNNVAGNRGGAIYASTLGASNGSSITIRNNSNLRMNRATAQLGGAVSLGSRTTTTIDGSNLSNNTAHERGGGIYVASFGNAVASVLTITGSTIAENQAVNLIGGGISQGPNVTTAISNSSIINNDAKTRGGGIFASGFGNARGTRVTINDSTISGNVSEELGGGLSLGSNATGKIYGSTVAENETETRGGGIYASTYGVLGQTVSLTVKDTVISGNIAPELGGGLNTGSQVTLNLERTRFLNNLTNGSGGAAYISGFWDTGTMSFPISNTRIADSTFDSNRAVSGDGGAIRTGRTTRFEISGSTFSNNETLGFDGGALSFGNAKETIITNSTFSGNLAHNDGGAIWGDIDPTAIAPTGPQSFRMNFTTITGNESDTDADGAGYGGGGLLISNGGADIRNSIISGNSDGSGAIADFADILYNASVAFTLIESNSGHLIADGVMGNRVGVSALLEPLANNGGLTQTHLPSLVSPVLNVADPAATVMNDQRGLPRPTGGGFDMGAVERALLELDGDFNDDGNYTCVDVNALSTAIATAGPVANFDLTGDGLLTLADLVFWLGEAGAANLGPGRAYKNGDANLDSFVDGTDFGIWNSNKFTANTNWCSGNFNADAVIDGSDFGIWNSNKFTAADQAREFRAEPRQVSTANPARIANARGPAKSNVLPPSHQQDLTVAANASSIASLAKSESLLARETKAAKLPGHLPTLGIAGQNDSSQTLKAKRLAADLSLGKTGLRHEYVARTPQIERLLASNSSRSTKAVSSIRSIAPPSVDLIFSGEEFR